MVLLMVYGVHGQAGHLVPLLVEMVNKQDKESVIILHHHQEEWTVLETQLELQPVMLLTVLLVRISLVCITF